MLERIICRHLVQSLECSDCFSVHQHGFRRKRSTVTLLLEAVNDWAILLEHRHSTHVLFLDFAKAFDSVPHLRLLLKLESLGIHGQVLQWIRAFLSDRLQRVVIGGSCSSWRSVYSGVPQGSVLDPLLFLLYVDDLYTCVTHSSVKLFADDVVLYTDINSVSDCSLLQRDLACIIEWSQRWQLRLNPEKCVALCLSNKRVPPSYDYSIDSHSISWKASVRYLGIVINSKLTWTDHCKSITKKASNVLNRLRRSMYHCSARAKSLAFKGLVRPLLEYACPVWILHGPGNVSLLETVQNRAARWICSRWNPVIFQWTKSSLDCLHELKWPTLQTRRTYFIVLTLYCILHSHLQVTFHAPFNFNYFSTRSHSLSLQPVSSSINAFRFSFFVHAPLLWNSIPYKVLNSVTSTFKSCLKSHLFSF